MSMKRIGCIVASLLLISLLFSCQTVTREEEPVKEAPVVEEPVAEKPAPKPEPEPVEEPKPLMKEDKTIKLIETSDVHGSLFPYDFINDRETSTSLAQVYTYVEEQRGMDQEVVLLDNGDILQGQPIVYYYNFENTKDEHIIASVMNAMEYDAGTVGNHDVEAGPDVYIKVAKECNFPWLAANAVSEKTGKAVVTPYTIIEKDGVKIAVLGMITPGIPNWLPENLYEGVFFEDMIDTAQKWVPIILSKEKPDIMVGLFHAGVDATYGGRTEDEKYNENASKLVAEQVPGFDIIFTGHDHKDTNMVVQDPNGKDVHILGALNAARSVATATVDVEWDVDAQEYKIAKIVPETVMMDGYAAHAGALAKFDYALQEVKEWVSRPIGTITETISTPEAMFGDSKFVDLIHRLQLYLTEADVSFAAPLSLNASIEEGTVYVRDMFNLYKYENLLYTMELTGQEIDDFLEYSYMNWFEEMDSIDDHIIRFKKDDNGELIFNERYNNYDTVTRYYNWDCAAGIKYTVDLKKPAGDKVNIKTLTETGEKFEMDEVYTVAINSYRGNGGGGHLTKGVGLSKEEIAERTIDSTVADLRFYFIKAFETRGTIEPEVDNNWFASPAMWAKRATELDYPLLFGE